MANWLITQNQTRAQIAGMPSKNPARTPKPAERAATSTIMTTGMRMIAA